MEKKSIHKKTIREGSECRCNQKGFVLVVSLAFLCILALLGSTAMVLTTTDMKIGENYKSSTQAFTAAQAGIAEARNRLKGSDTASGYVGDTGVTADPLWLAYILTSGTWTTADDPDYNGAYLNYFPSGTTFTGTSPQANTLQSSVDVDYFVKIRHKREYDAEQAGHSTTIPHYIDGDSSTGTHTAASPGSIVYYGDDNPSDNTNHWVEFTSAGNPTQREARPVEIIRAYGQSAGALSVLEIEVKRIPLNINSEGVVYAKNNVTSNGTVTVDGHDHAGTSGAVNCGGATAAPMPPIYTYPSGTVTTLNGVSNTLDGDPPNEVSGDVDIPITEYVAAMGLPGSATEIITEDQNGTTYGADGNGNSVICYSDTSDPYNVQGLKLQGVTGYGLLAVDGDLELGGGFTWHGLVLATGTLVFNGGGGPNRIQITGAVLANQTVTMNGSVDLYYDSCYIQEALQSTTVQVSRWQQVY